MLSKSFIILFALCIAGTQLLKNKHTRKASNYQDSLKNNSQLKQEVLAQDLNKDKAQRKKKKQRKTKNRSIKASRKVNPPKNVRRVKDHKKEKKIKKIKTTNEKKKIKTNGKKKRGKGIKNKRKMHKQTRKKILLKDKKNRNKNKKIILRSKKIISQNNKKEKNQKKKKQRRSKKQKQLRNSIACSDVTCLNNMVKALKIEKDTVRNFLAQEKRVQSKINLMGMPKIYLNKFLCFWFLVNKLGKSDLRDDNVRFLAARIGNRTLVETQGALCAGSFNNTEGVKVLWNL